MTLGETKIPERLYFRIGEVAELSGVKPHVLRYWESEFPSVSPEKSASGQRVYRRTHVETVLLIKHLLYQERYSIEGARKKIRELRKQGDLKAFKEERVLAPSPDREARLRRLKALALELRQLAEFPLEETFRIKTSGVGG